MYYQQLMCCNAKETPCHEKKPRTSRLFLMQKNECQAISKILKISLKHTQKTTTNTIPLNQLKQINAI